MYFITKNIYLKIIKLYFLIPKLLVYYVFYSIVMIYLIHSSEF